MEGLGFHAQLMALLPDLAVASVLALVVFLLALGLLVVFIESVRPARLVAVLLAGVAVSGALAVLGETGLALVAMALAAAVLANQGFEWLTTR